MIVPTALLSFLCLSTAPCEGVRNAAVITGQSAIDSLIADISERRRDRAIARVSDVITVTGRSRIVRTPAQFVDRLLGCVSVPSSVRQVGRDYFQIDWVCGKKKYFAYLDADFMKPYIVVMLEDEITAMEPVYAPAPPLPGPDRHVPPSLELINSIAGSLLTADQGAVRYKANPQTSVSLARRDRSHNVVVYERDELGPGAIAPITRAAFDRVGKPVSFECVQERYGGTCKFIFDRPGVALTCWIGTYDGVLNAIRFVWETSEQNLLDAKKIWDGA